MPISLYTIPLTSSPNQDLQVSIPIDGKNVILRLKIRYNTVGNYWWMTVRDKDGNVLIDSLPLLTGEHYSSDILKPYRYLGLGSAVVINIGDATLDYPDSTTLGVNFILVWGDTLF